MRTQTVLQTNFQTGEVSPLMRMRADTQPWRNGVKRLRNMRQLMHGGARTRPPLKYHATAGADGVLIPFVFSSSQAYVFHLKNLDLRIFYDDGTVAVSSTVMPYGTSDLRYVRWAQSGDVIMFFHPDYAPRIIRRTGAATFTLSTMAFDDTSTADVTSQPFFRYEAASITLTPSGTSGSITVTASTSIFAANWVGDYIRIGGKQVELTAYTSGTQVTGTVRQTLAGTGATTDWDEQAFSTRRGWPACGAFHDERLVLAGAKNRRSGIWLSKVGQFFNFDVGTGQDDEAIWSGVSGDKVNAIEHLVSHRHLLPLSDFAETYCPQSETRPLTPENFSVRPQTPFGTMDTVRPCVFDESVMSAQKYGRAIRELLYTEAATAYSADPVSVLAEHLIQTPISMDGLTQSASVSEQYLFVVMNDGTMAVLHSLRSQKITGWSLWSTPDGLFRSVCVVNGKVFVLVNRWSGTYTLEEFKFDLEDFALDCFVSASAGATLTGLSHLNSRTVGIVSDGQYYGTGVPSSGSVTVDPATTATTYVGLAYTPEIQTLPPELQDESGSTIDRPMRIVRCSLNVAESIRFGVNGYNIEVRNVNDDLSEAPDPKTGTYDFAILGWGRDPTVTISVDVPLAITILGLGLRVAVRNEQ
jgi:hypothetical protein